MEISERLRFIMNHLKLNSAEFADKLHVQPSNISHLLAGRNKPSVDFLSKLVQTFPSIDLKWLITGHGNLNMDQDKELDEQPISNRLTETKSSSKISLESKLMDSSTTPSLPSLKNNKKVTKVILIYNDNTFDVY